MAGLLGGIVMKVGETHPTVYYEDGFRRLRFANVMTVGETHPTECDVALLIFRGGGAGFGSE